MSLGDIRPVSPGSLPECGVKIPPTLYIRVFYLDVLCMFSEKNCLHQWNENSTVFFTVPERVVDFRKIKHSSFFLLLFEIFTYLLLKSHVCDQIINLFPVVRKQNSFKPYKLS